MTAEDETHEEFQGHAFLEDQNIKYEDEEEYGEQHYDDENYEQY